MPRYILIDSNSGYIYGDTADLPRVPISISGGEPMSQSDLTSIVDAARWLDETVVNLPGRSYEVLPADPRNTGYHVYRADIDGSEAISTVFDGQDPEIIAAVERSCRYEGFVRVTPAKD